MMNEEKKNKEIMNENKEEIMMKMIKKLVK